MDSLENQGNFIEQSGRTADEAIAEALSKLKIKKEEAKITILEPGSKGFLGIGAKPAKVRVETIFDPEGKAKSFLRELAIAIGVSVDVKTEIQDKTLNIELSGDDMGVFIGKRGQTLDSLQYLVNLAINKGQGGYVSVVLDSENYRKRRKETLESLSMNLAKKVKQTGRAIVLEPMSSSERRIIHSVLQNDKFVTTHSEGDEPFRNVVIVPKKGVGKKPERADRPERSDKPFADRQSDKPSGYKPRSGGYSKPYTKTYKKKDFADK